MGSEFVSGHQIMDFWDRLCTTLRIRKISLVDEAKTRRMHLRLLHGVADGEPWFGRWSYRFVRGSFNLTHHAYLKALHALRSTPLQNLTLALVHLPLLLSRYQPFSPSPLQTLSDLFKLLLDLHSKLPENSFSSSENCLSSPENGFPAPATACRWSAKRLEMATCVIIEALNQAKNRWVSRQEVRDSARAYVGDTGLLDFVLKALGNQVIGDRVIRRVLNPVTKVLEYRLEDLCRNPFSGPENYISGVKMAHSQISRSQVAKDLAYLYKNVLRDNGRNSGFPATGIHLPAIKEAVRAVLDAKHLVKDYEAATDRGGSSHEGAMVRVLCSVSLENGDISADGEISGARVSAESVVIPAEFVSIPARASVGDLKRELESAFGEIYFGLRGIFVAEVVGARASDPVGRMVKSGHEVVARGRVPGGSVWCEGKREKGGVVDCLCGAREEDGERMVCCDVCEVWQHARCSRVDGDDVIPTIFLCTRCEQDLVVLPTSL
ncbi:PHD finger protein PERSISTENT TAPETAL CELL 1 [Amborella trichopoda]|nr:PHD finger protein PERSISTENT TAPETAL CELL 1 [Amborella trichopoda]|eukprot:XP_020526012.1 PHD finger protein PERSISTENT TAPETAL CELL 1 [Amborella trichopoda]